MATKKASPAQIAARKLFAERSKAGLLTKKPKASRDYARDAAVDRAEAALRIAKKTAKRKSNPIAKDAGEFKMTVDGKTKTRFFVHDDDAWANSYGFQYRLLSDVTDFGAPIKFTKTRAIVAVDEAANGSPVTETWEIRGLKFYQSNPRKKTVSQKISQLTHEGYPQKQAVAVALSEQRAGKVKRNPSMYAEKYKVDIAEWMREYEQLEDINAHSENVVRLAELVGTKADQIAAKKILSNHLTIGYLSDIDYKNRQKIHSKLWPKAMKLFGMEIKKNPTRQRATRRTAVMPNPIEKRVAKSKLKANFPYLVEYKNTGTGNWNAKAAFTTLAEAKNLAYMFAEQYPNLTIRVVRFTGGPM